MLKGLPIEGESLVHWWIALQMLWPKSRKQRGVLERPTWLLIVSEVLSGGHSFDCQGKCLQICSNILRHGIRGDSGRP